ncbi:MAG: trypsin-like peptidase domain-containing protein, partial [Caldilinea sp.]
MMVFVTMCAVVTLGFVRLIEPQPSRTTETLTSPTLTPVAFQLTPRPQIVVQPSADGIDYESAVLRNIYEQNNRSVVNITVWMDHPPLDETSLLPIPTPSGSNGELLPLVNGSGFVWDALGHIVTNQHVVDEGQRFQVTFYDGATALGEVVGRDQDSDLAVIKIDPEGYDLAPVKLGSMDDVYVGMRVAAIGNPFGLQGTLTSGIVSAIGRTIPSRSSFSIPDSIQTDAAINPGNSGGPLFNERGEVIGVNAQIRSEVRANSGVGFAIPIAIVERVVPGLIADGRYQHSYMGISGVTFSPLCSDEQGIDNHKRGVIVDRVLSNTPAARAGLRGSSRPMQTAYISLCPGATGGDFVVAVEGRSISTFDDLLIYLARYTSPGDTITLTVERRGEMLDVPLTLAPRPR